MILSKIFNAAFKNSVLKERQVFRTVSLERWTLKMLEYNCGTDEHQLIYYS